MSCKNWKRYRDGENLIIDHSWVSDTVQVCACVFSFTLCDNPVKSLSHHFIDPFTCQKKKKWSSYHNAQHSLCHCGCNEDEDGGGLCLWYLCRTESGKGSVAMHSMGIIEVQSLGSTRMGPNSDLGKSARASHGNWRDLEWPGLGYKDGRRWIREDEKARRVGRHQTLEGKVKSLDLSQDEWKGFKWWDDSFRCPF